MSRTQRTIVILALLVFAFFVAYSMFASQGAAPESAPEAPPPPAVVVDSQEAQAAVALGDFLADLDEWYAGLARAEEAARQAASAAAAAPRIAPAVTVGECTGFAIPDYIIARESGGNPSAYNPSGAYGCAQTLLSHYSAGRTCDGTDPYTIEGQRECVWRLSNGGTNLAPWAM